MNPNVKEHLRYFIILAALYAAPAFYHVTLDFGRWAPGARGLFAVAALLVTLAGIYGGIKADQEKHAEARRKAKAAQPDNPTIDN